MGNHCAQNQCVRDCEKIGKSTGGVEAIDSHSPAPGFSGSGWLPRGTPGKALFSAAALQPDDGVDAGEEVNRAYPSGEPQGGMNHEPGMTGVVGEDGSTYFGQWLNGKRHGYGTLVVTENTAGRYEGQFFEDMRHGQGVLSWTDGRRYSGQFVQGRFHGSASMVWPDGRQYVGQYADSRKHGDGTFCWPDGRQYEGQWLDGKRHGIGEYTNAKGSTRIGDWKDDKPIRWRRPADSSLVMATPRSQASDADAAGEEGNWGYSDGAVMSEPSPTKHQPHYRSGPVHVV